MPASSLQVTIPVLRPPFHAHVISAPASPASWVHQHSTFQIASSQPSSPVQVSPLPIWAAALPPSRAQVVFDSTKSQSSTLVSSPSYLSALDADALPVHYVEPPSPSVASLVEMSVHTPSRTDLLGEDFDVPSPQFLSPIHPDYVSPQENSQSSLSTNMLGTHQDVRSVSTISTSPPKSPPSATALSSSVNQLANRSRSTTLVEDDLQPSQASCSSCFSGSGSQTRHSVFYMRDEMVVLDVSGCLYRVHRHFLERNSEFFRKIFSGCTSEDASTGGTDDTAIVLPGVGQHEFDVLLDFLYYRVFEDEAVSLSEWITLLNVSTRLRFSRVRACAIREITARRESLSAVEIIVLAIRHDIPGWLASAYADLCRRTHPLDDLEAEELGARITARVGRARETIRDETYRSSQEKRNGNRSSGSETLDEEIVSRVVMDVFWLGDGSRRI
ncbi:uncharacterized protein FIBRA_01383 [Fibroporia radiculosa]|uniref:BTB domain-containing protein n=1 Tax=Fibroporia radiculosa TaxID=599839 RepID=J4GK09_9APHY|nr:uncharacterized protein FIBRA_01383 [Fibroporia radiculosa]CCL99365.1 predicted protein [Fibroporia radiculosa]